jgi:hypothetical protein
MKRKRSLTCKRGHVRKVLGRTCHECSNIRRRERYATEPHFKARKHAQAAGSRARNRLSIRVASRESGWKAKGLPTPLRPMPDVCDCCHRPPNASRSLALDHCHETNVFRGWLCVTCNVGIGALGDTYEGIMRAAKYLQTNSVFP